MTVNLEEDYKAKAQMIYDMSNWEIKEVIKEDDGFNLLLEDSNTGINLWIDVWNGTWDYNQYIFNTHNSKDCLMRELQPLLVEDIDYLVDDYVVMTCEEEVNV